MTDTIQERQPGDGWDSPIPPPPYVFTGTNALLAVLMDTPGLKHELILPMLRQLRDAAPVDWEDAPFVAVLDMMIKGFEV